MQCNKIKYGIFITLIISIFFSFQLISKEIKSDIPEKHFVLFVAGRNNAQWYKKNLDSIFYQQYENYHVIYVDDASDDGTPQLVAEYVKERGLEHKITLIANQERRYKMTSQYETIHNLCKNSDIIVEIDADDWFTHDKVLSFLNAVYADEDIWFTYSRLIYYPSGVLEDKKCNPVPEDVVKNNGFRKYRWVYTGMLSYYAGLFKQIKKDDLFYKGKDKEFYGGFTPISSDFSIILPMIEMSRKGHFRYLPNILYVYNIDRPSIYSERMVRVRKERNRMLRRMPSYPALDMPLW